MKPLVIFFLLFNMWPAIRSQHQVVSTAGSSLKNGMYSIDWTLGEAVIQTFSSSAKNISQGFHQNILINPISGDINNQLVSVSVYPNPAENVLLLEIKGTDFSEVVYALYEVTGNRLLQASASGEITPVGLGEYPAGIYLLQILRGANEIIIFKVVKN